MNNDFLQLLDRSFNKDDINLRISYTTNDLMLKFIVALQNYLIINVSEEKYKIYNNFLEHWKNEFATSLYDEIKSLEITKLFPWKVEFQIYENIIIYCLFNVDYLINICKKDGNYPIANLNGTNLDKIVYDNSIQINHPFEINNNDFGILVDTYYTPRYVLVDGNHRLINSLLQEHEFQTFVITFNKIEEEMFINNFNFKVFKFLNFLNLLLTYSSETTEEILKLAKHLYNPNAIIFEP